MECITQGGISNSVSKLLRRIISSIIHKLHLDRGGSFICMSHVDFTQNVFCNSYNDELKLGNIIIYLGSYVGSYSVTVPYVIAFRILLFQYDTCLFPFPCYLLSTDCMYVGHVKTKLLNVPLFFSLLCVCSPPTQPSPCTGSTVQTSSKKFSLIWSPVLSFGLSQRILSTAE